MFVDMMERYYEQPNEFKVPLCMHVGLSLSNILPR